MKIKTTFAGLGLAVAALFTLNSLNPSAHAQGTAFTYQGVLNDDGAPATGLYDLEFRAFNAVTGGAQQGGAVTANDVPVTNGLFTVTLDFGAAVFTGPARWLNIAVRPGASGGGYTDMLPRQPLTTTPYAVFAGGAAAAGLTGTLADAQLSANVALRGTSNLFNGHQIISNGNVTVRRDANGLLGPTLTLANGAGPAVANAVAIDLNANPQAVPATAQILASDEGNFSAGIRLSTKNPGAPGNPLVERMRITSGGNVGIGTTLPTAPLSIGSSLADTKLAVWDNGVGGKIGFGIQDNQFRFHVNNGADRFSFLNGAAGSEVMTVRGNGTVGIGTTNPASQLHVIGQPLFDFGSFGYANIGTSGGNPGLTIFRGTHPSGTARFDAANRGNIFTLGFNVSGADTLSISDGERVGINATSPLATLEVISSGSSVIDVGDGTGILNVGPNNNKHLTMNEDQIAAFNGNTPAHLFLNFSGGNVAIGAVNPPAAKLHVAGEARATVFTPTSDRNAKENFTSVNARDVLEKVAALPITEWNYKTLAGARHMGPVAQDFQAAFGLGSDDKGISTVDADGVALAAIQGLNQKLETENAELKRRLEALERLVTETLKK